MTKKLLRVCLISILILMNVVCAMAQAQVTTAPIPANVKYAVGTNDVEIGVIQEKLRSLGYYSASRNNYVMDNDTLYALRLFCEAHGLEYSDQGITYQAYEFLTTSNNLIPRVTPEPADTEDQYPPLYYGQTGAAVLSAQTELKKLGYYEGLRLNPGVYDEDMQKAVEALCKENNIEFDYYAATMSGNIQYLLFSGALKERTSPVNIGGDGSNGASSYRHLKGSNNAMEMGSLQERLQELGYFTGNFTYELDNDTMYALKKLCFDNRLPFDENGITYELWDRLFNRDEPLITPTPVPTAGAPSKDSYDPLEYGQEDEAVGKLQQRLKALGYLTGEYELGLYGETTQQAVEAFCHDNGIKYTLESGVTDQMHAAIFSDDAKEYTEEKVELGTFQKVRMFLVSKQRVLGIGLPGWMWTFCGVLVLAGFVYLLVMLFVNPREAEPEQKPIETETSESSPRSITIMPTTEKSICTIDVSIRYQRQERSERVRIEENCIVGRTSECQIRLDDKDRSMSRQHCTLHMSGGNVVLLDHSVNGTFVNDHHYHNQECNLHSGDRIQIGQHLLVLKF